MDTVEEHLSNASTPLESAREEALKALEIPNLPQYIESELRSLATNIEWVVQKPRSDIARIRRDLPKHKLAAEQSRGEQQALV